MMNHYNTIQDIKDNYAVVPRTLRKRLQKGTIKGIKCPCGHTWLIPKTIDIEPPAPPEREKKTRRIFKR